MDIVAV
jgi:hypothetical protein